MLLWRSGHMIEVDQDGERDDRPAVVPDELVDPVQRAQQRHDEEVEDAEVDRPDHLAIDLHQFLEPLRPEVEPHVVPGPIELHPERDERTRPDGRLVGNDPVIHACRRALGREERHEEVVVVGADVAQSPLLRRVGSPEGRRRQPRHRAGVVDDAFGCLVVGRREERAGGRALDLAEAGSAPDRERHGGAVEGGGDRHGQDVGRCRVPELEVLPDGEAADIGVVERQRTGRRPQRQGVNARLEQRGVDARGHGGILGGQGKARDLAAGLLRRHHVNRAAVAVEILLEFPVEEDAAARREHGAHVIGVDHDVALGRVAHEGLDRLCRRDGRCRRGRGRRWRPGSSGRGGRGLGRSRRRGLCRCGGPGSGLLHRGGSHDEVLIAGEHDERQRDREQDFLFHDQW